MERLIPASSVLLIVDVQERLAAAMPKESIDRLVKNAEVLLEAAHRLGVKVLATEQYPKGLGPTVGALASRLSALGVTPADKTVFDASNEPRIARALGEVGPRSVVVAGMESHICVFQTARELVRRGYTTYVVEDAVASRTAENRAAGVALCARAGAIVTVTEAVAFDWLGRAEGEHFKAISKMIR